MSCAVRMKLCDTEMYVVIIFVVVLVIYAVSVNKLWNDDISYIRMSKFGDVE